MTAPTAPAAQPDVYFSIVASPVSAVWVTTPAGSYPVPPSELAALRRVLDIADGATT